jgi:hypothetical protein
LVISTLSSGDMIPREVSLSLAMATKTKPPPKVRELSLKNSK